MSIVRRLSLALFACIVVAVVGCSAYESPQCGGAAEIEEFGYNQHLENSCHEPEVVPPTDAELRQMTGGQCRFGAFATLQQPLREMGVLP